MRNNDGRCPAWFKAAHGLRQGCVLSPRLLNVFFAAILLVAPERFTKDSNVLEDPSHVQE